MDDFWWREMEAWWVPLMEILLPYEPCEYFFQAVCEPDKTLSVLEEEMAVDWISEGRYQFCFQWESDLPPETIRIAHPEKWDGDWTPMRLGVAVWVALTTDILDNLEEK